MVFHLSVVFQEVVIADLDTEEASKRLMYCSAAAINMSLNQTPGKMVQYMRTCHEHYAG
jgi:hypothetical protein